MIRQLHILNYAIIEEITIDFSGRLNVITGETGAGKSILMGALSLILGDRADTSVLLNREKKCFIEGVFSVDQIQGAGEFLKANDLDAEDELVIRREIAANGKSRAFINDTPVNLEQLRQLSSLLVDLHRQFDTLELGEMDFQREVLDALSGQGELLTGYSACYRKLVAAKKELAMLMERKEQFTKEFDYNQFLYNELAEADLKENELEDLDAELKLLSNSEGIKNALTKAYYELKEGEHPIVQQLKISLNQLQPFSALHPALPVVLQRLHSTQIELMDIAGELQQLNDHIGFDPARIEEMNERISTGYKLMRKHGVQSTRELIAIQADLESKLQAVLGIEDNITAQEKQVELLEKQAREKAGLISKNRKATIGPLESKVNQLLSQVGMPNARLRIVLSQVELNSHGMDAIEFLFDANKSERFEPIRKVASGGELSRLMLCIKSLVAQTIDLPTLIFDEIDTGISGEAARQVGIILKDLSSKRQVICITHQPQIAGKADAHYFVFKEVKGSSIKTNIRILGKEERITAIARMLSGEKPTAAALENAREMVVGE